MSEATRYDEQDAIKFIRATLSDTVNQEYSDDDITYVIDLIWEWYENNGYLELDSEVTEEEEHDLTKITDYVKMQIKKDRRATISLADIDLIVKGEIEYEMSIDEFI